MKDFRVLFSKMKKGRSQSTSALASELSVFQSQAIPDRKAADRPELLCPPADARAL
jgi:hypothetical protein